MVLRTTLPLALALVFLGCVMTAPSIGPECQNFLDQSGFTSIDDLANTVKVSAYPGVAPCEVNSEEQLRYAPSSLPSINGAADTTDMACRYGNPYMWNFSNVSHRTPSVCCGLKPHFNWILGDCKSKGGKGVGQFCRGLNQCIPDGSPKINYIAAYQYNGTEFVLMNDSSVGELSSHGISGNYAAGTGFEKHKADFQWRGGDWTTKYAPWHNVSKPGPSPRGLTPPALMWVLSAENFYYGAFYMLSQLGLNLEGNGNPTGTNCWNWEYDPIEGTAGWNPGKDMPGNVNMLYNSGTAQNSGCMPVPYSSLQMNGLKKKLKYPKEFKDYCKHRKGDPHCIPSIEVEWSGGGGSSQRYENYWGMPYVFAIVIDSKGYWNYRWRPDAYEPGSTTKTGWPGLERYSAASSVPANPKPVKDPRGLKTDVPGDVAEAVMLQPSLNNEESCLRASIEEQDWQFGSNAIAAMAAELGLNGKGQAYEGAHNWWNYFVDTKQWNRNYPVTIAGIPSSELSDNYQCKFANSTTCNCRAAPRDAARPEASEIIV